MTSHIKKEDEPNEAEEEAEDAEAELEQVEEEPVIKARRDSSYSERKE